MCEVDVTVPAVVPVLPSDATQLGLDAAAFDDAALCAGTLTLRNIVPAPFIAQRIQAADSMVLFSATLNPPDYYRDLLCLPDTTQMLDVPPLSAPSNWRYAWCRCPPGATTARHRCSRWPRPWAGSSPKSPATTSRSSAALTTWRWPSAPCSSTGPTCLCGRRPARWTKPAATPASRSCSARAITLVARRRSSSSSRSSARLAWDSSTVRGPGAVDHARNAGLAEQAHIGVQRRAQRRNRLAKHRLAMLLDRLHQRRVARQRAHGAGQQHAPDVDRDPRARRVPCPRMMVAQVASTSAGFPRGSCAGRA
jgi:hypothetical protein